MQRDGSQCWMKEESIVHEVVHNVCGWFVGGSDDLFVVVLADTQPDPEQAPSATSPVQHESSLSRPHNHPIITVVPCGFLSLFSWDRVPQWGHLKVLGGFLIDTRCSFSSVITLTCGTLACDL